jgi:transposase InsO family protein
MSRTTSPSSSKPYGLALVSRVWHVARSTVYAQRCIRELRDRGVAAHRRGPIGPCDDATMVSAIRKVLAASPFHGEGYRKVWARLRMAGLRTSKRRVLRVMREAGLTTVRRLAPADVKRHDGTIVTERPDVMWATDTTATVTTGEGQVCVFAAVDHCTSECLGIHAAKSGNRFEALEPIRQAARQYLGGYAEEIAHDLSLRHDHGSPYLSDDFQRELRFLGITSSPAFVREPEGNGCIERFFRTLKENLLWIRDFATVEELRLALLEFRRLYNEHWILERHGYLTPAQVRAQFTTRQAAAA